MITDRQKCYPDENPDGFLYCIHCERTYKNGQYRQVGEFQMCPYEDCDGDTVMDAWEWEVIREHHPEYPEKPENGVVYPMYH